MTDVVDVVRAITRRGIHALKGAWQDREGSALLEGAVVLPLLFVLMFGIYDFSWYFYQQHLIATGVRDAARYLARSPAPCDAASPIWASGTANAGNLATTGFASGGPTRVRGWNSEMVRIDCTAIDNPAGVDGLRTYRGGPFVYVVTVSTRFADPSLGFFRVIGLSPPMISVSHSARAVGPG
jgi:TadE-like protein